MFEVEIGVSQIVLIRNRRLNNASILRLLRFHLLSELLQILFYFLYFTYIGVQQLLVRDRFRQLIWLVWPSRIDVPIPLSNFFYSILANYHLFFNRIIIFQDALDGYIYLNYAKLINTNIKLVKWGANIERSEVIFNRNKCGFNNLRIDIEISPQEDKL